MADIVSADEQKTLSAHLDNIDAHPHNLDLDGAEKLLDEEAEFIKEIKHRVAHGISVRHRDMLHILAHVCEEVEKQKALIEKLKKIEETEKDPEKLTKAEEETLKEELELNGEIDANFATVFGTIVYIFRALNAYYVNKKQLSKILFKDEQYQKIDKDITTFLEWMPRLVKYKVIGGSEEKKVGMLLIMSKALRRLSTDEGYKDARLRRRGRLKKLFGTDEDFTTKKGE